MKSSTLQLVDGIVPVVEDDMSDDERAALHEELGASLAEGMTAGPSSGARGHRPHVSPHLRRPVAAGYW